MKKVALYKTVLKGRRIFIITVDNHHNPPRDYRQLLNSISFIEKFIIGLRIFQGLLYKNFSMRNSREIEKFRKISREIEKSKIPR